MNHSEHHIPVCIACIGGGSLNWAPNLMADLAQETRLDAEALTDGAADPVPTRSDEALVDQIVALMGGAPFGSNVKLPNRGQIEGLPPGAVVETNALFSGLGVTPLLAGRLPDPLNALVAGHASRQTARLDAVMAGDHAALFHAIPLMAPLPERQARALFAERLRATAARLPAPLLAEAA